MMNENKPVRIFLVEDNEMFAETMKVSLEMMGYSVMAFRSGEHMISAWDEDPDMILLDYFIETEMGVAMNGEKILRFIRRISKNLPVIVMTSNTDIGEATGMLKLGAVDFIVKDDDLMASLKKTIGQVLESRKLREELTRNRLKIANYRQRLIIIVMAVALAVITLLWLFT